jgi:hypothetical protein
MAEEKKEEKDTPEVSPPETKEETPKEETPAEAKAPETAEKPDKTPEVEPEEAPEEVPKEESPEEEEVEKQVPLSELQKERERRRQAEQAMFDTQQPQTPTDVPELEPDAQQAVSAVARQEAAQMYEQRRAGEFVRKHGTALQSDPLLDNTIKGIMADENRQGRYIDPFDALEQAKELLDSRLKPQVDKAKEESFKEGQSKAKEKAKAGAVGTSGPRPEVDPDKMSSDEYAKYYNLPRAN